MDKVSTSSERSMLKNPAPKVWKITCLFTVFFSLVSAGISSAQNSEEQLVEIDVLTSEPMKVLVNNKAAVMHPSGEFGFVQAKVGAVNKLEIVHKTARTLMYSIDGAGFKVAKPTDGTNHVEFDVSHIRGAGDFLRISTNSELTLFDGDTEFTFRDLATKESHEVYLSGELFDSLGLACRTLTFHSTLDGNSYRSGFRRWWRHELDVKVNLCDTENSEGLQILRPACCSRGCGTYTDLCTAVLTLPTPSGTIKVSLNFRDLDLSVRYQDKDIMTLLPKARGNLRVTVE